MNKAERAIYGPSWAEVILGAALSAIVGVVLGALLLVLRPVAVVKEIPKEPERDAVYFVEGSRDAAKARQALAKRKGLVAGMSVTVNEDELNSLVTPAPGGPAPKAGDKKGAEKAAAAASDESFSLGTPNFRIDDGRLQVGVPVTINTLDLGRKVIVQARGGFVKKGDMFVYEPSELYLGSCPVQRLPFLSTYVRDKFLAGQPIPDDIKASWPKLTDVAIEGKTLKLTMP
jgi:hypothetical protein